MQEEVFVWGTFGTFAGILLAVVLFVLALRFVARARIGNRRVREAQHDPHVGDGEHGPQAEQAAKDHRDISQ